MKVAIEIMSSDGRLIRSVTFTNYQAVVNYVNCAYYNIVQKGQVYTIKNLEYEQGILGDGAKDSDVHTYSHT